MNFDEWAEQELVSPTLLKYKPGFQEYWNECVKCLNLDITLPIEPFDTFLDQFASIRYETLKDESETSIADELWR